MFHTTEWVRTNNNKLSALFPAKSDCLQTGVVLNGSRSERSLVIMFVWLETQGGAQRIAGFVWKPQEQLRVFAFFDICLETLPNDMFFNVWAKLRNECDEMALDPALVETETNKTHHAEIEAKGFLFKTRERLHWRVASFETTPLTQGNVCHLLQGSQNPGGKVECWWLKGIKRTKCIVSHGISGHSSRATWSCLLVERESEGNQKRKRAGQLVESGSELKLV